MDRDDALAFTCGPVCIDVLTVDWKTLSAPTITSAQLLDRDKDTVTWLAEGVHFLIMVQTHNGTRIYDPENDMLYYAAPHVQLPPTCPPGYAFLCQPVQDQEPGGLCVPRLLVTDLVAPPIECPVKRNEALRGLSGIMPEACHLQWAGKREACEAFIQRGAVPHRVAGLIALRAPLQIVREKKTRIAALDTLELPP